MRLTWSRRAILLVLIVLALPCQGCESVRKWRLAGYLQGVSGSWQALARVASDLQAAGQDVEREAPGVAEHLAALKDECARQADALDGMQVPEEATILHGQLQAQWATAGEIADVGTRLNGDSRQLVQTIGELKSLRDMHLWMAEWHAGKQRARVAEELRTMGSLCMRFDAQGRQVRAEWIRLVDENGLGTR